MENWKIWNETAFIELCSFFIDLLAFEQGKLCPGWGFLFRFLPRGPEFWAEKLSRGEGILTEKISGPAVSPGGGMVTGQIDTCIICTDVCENKQDLTLEECDPEHEED